MYATGNKKMLNMLILDIEEKKDMFYELAVERLAMLSDYEK